MECTILSNFNFKKIGKDDVNDLKIFNPDKIQTNREKYVFVNKLNIFESIYMKI